MNYDTSPEGQFLLFNSDELGKDLPPSPKVSESQSKWPFLNQISDSPLKKKPARRSYKLETRVTCCECQPEGMGAIQKCMCLECPLWQYRVFKSKIHKAVTSGDWKSLSPIEKEEAAEVSQQVSDARDSVLMMARKHCPQKIGYFVRAFSGKSRKAALLAERLYLANYEAKMVDPDRRSSEPVSE